MILYDCDICSQLPIKNYICGLNKFFISFDDEESTMLGGYATTPESKVNMIMFCLILNF